MSACDNTCYTHKHIITHTLRTAASVKWETGWKRGDSVQAKVTLLKLSAARKCMHGWEIQWAPETTACPLNVVPSRDDDKHMQLWINLFVYWWWVFFSRLSCKVQFTMLLLYVINEYMNVYWLKMSETQPFNGKGLCTSAVYFIVCTGLTVNYSYHWIILLSYCSLQQEFDILRNTLIHFLAES